MKKMISIVFGTRPELIKLAPVILQAQQDSRFQVEVIFTGQHDELVRDAIEFFQIKIDHRLKMMNAGQSLNQLLIQGLSQLEGVFNDGQQRDAIIIQGDTTTVLAAGLVAFSMKIPVAHVEAGLRSYDLEHPFPEEGNRQLVSRITQWHFAPTEQSKQNLLQEHIATDAITVTGNTVVDAVYLGRELIQRKGAEQNYLQQHDLNFSANSRVVLITAHRRENFGEGIQNICNAVQHLAQKYRDVHFVWPVHLNPAVHDLVHAQFDGHAQVHLVKPLDYPSLLAVIDRASFILTDSGGLQEESPSFNKPVLILRETTERPEVVQVGAGILVGTDQEKIVAEAEKLLSDQAHYELMANVPNPFGDGKASQRILDQIADGWSHD
ncbi:UDP-N-acetylglucosamine 2-epimerase (non-hydrolyzing) [Acinetobacter sp. C26M]|uniref:non-hydrolyzing UDP-N-acetylglucosamine 2-epimerase n=1 Tax=unclassified Acinetobacter TaxID=196816 RepID=UPI002036D6D0|nr:MULTISPECIES: UDP-N-acetylglucosamine 2-epimerase (non-hydrolyzing) [unclassified Acinetobacter]USA45688.1 UDP-N-acetylglucosamine 2-epimerase (non-hydrolyzing) [Acinetobacter sp. C26M]USA49187.1 UDP-N-acetylglucosamine 2-epimerase (non-hydrolyzing) [Acinetobacter sp. C26G]